MASYTPILFPPQVFLSTVPTDLIGVSLFRIREKQSGLGAYFTPGSVVCAWECMEFPVHLHEQAAVRVRFSLLTRLTVINRFRLVTFTTLT